MDMQSKAKKLIEMIQTTPVEWKPLGEVSKISSGGTPKTGISKYYDGDIPWLRTQEVNFNDIWNTEIKITKEGLQNSSAKLIPANCVIIAMYGATVGRVGINKIPLSTNQACANICVNKDILNYRFVFHYLCSQYEYIKSLGTGSQTNINAQIVKNIKIPIPPLEIQAKIVKILDKFTELEATLEAELHLRKQQYNYYRDYLLTFDESGKQSLIDRLDGLPENIVWKQLGEVCCIETGKLNANAADENGKFAFFTTSKEIGRINKYRWDTEALLIAGNANVGDVKHFIGKFEAYQRTYVLTDFINKLMPRYLYFILSNSLQDYLSERKNSAAMTYIVLSTLEKFLIPIPPLVEQARIVAILDKFDTLTTSLSDGLPREIALRRRQYEYYREKLLNFPKAHTTCSMAG